MGNVLSNFGNYGATCPKGEFMVSDDSGASYCSGVPDATTPTAPPPVLNNPMGKQQQGSSIYDTSLSSRNQYMDLSPIHL
tara:strand:- start:680 stop:919 length:240 start_codon:yes stop_codon:yes gene_type:complete